MIRSFFTTAVFLACALPGIAQTTFEVSFARNLPPDRRLIVTAQETVNGARGGGYGWVQVDIKNPDRESHEVEMVVEEAYGRSSKYVATRTVLLEPGAHTTQFLPLPSLRRTMELICRVDGFDRGRGRHRIDVEDRSYGLAGLAVTDHAGEHASWKELFDNELTIGFPKQTVRRWVRGKQKTEVLSVMQHFPHRGSTALPPRWQMLSGFDFVVIDGRGVEAAPSQQVLADYVQAGGSALLYHADHLDGDSILRQAFPRMGAGRHGFGTYFVCDGAVPFLDERRRRAIDDWFGGASSGVLARHGKSHSQPLSQGVHWGDGIPGLGDIPVGLFFFVLLAFAILAGPFNYFYWKRQRRLSMLLLTVPGAGFGVTAVILAAGLLSEGLGVKGCIASVSLLDQVEHEATTWTSRELYAGLTPGELTPDSRTYVFSSNVRARHHWRSPVSHVQRVDLDRGGTIAGQLVPARYQSNVTTASIRTVRDRMRFRVRGDGKLETLVGPEFGLESVGANSIVFRDFDGDYYAGGQDGLLSPIDAVDWQSRIRSLLRTNTTATPDPAFLEMVDRLPGGYYVAACTRNPCFDDFGLTVNWLRSIHTVIGTIAQEDLVRD